MNFKLGIRPPHSAKSPAVTVTTEEKKRSTVNVFIDAACPICQEPVGQRTPEGRVEAWSRLPCGHKFGSYCIKHWLGIVADEKPCCPICRHDASHSCGHPVLPQLIPASNANRSTKTADEEKPFLAFGDSGRWLGFQCGPCVFCRQDRVFMPRKKKRGEPWRFVKGCWRLVRTGRARERARVPVSMFAQCHGFRNVEWQSWWKEQEPRTA